MITETDDAGTFNFHRNEYTRPINDRDPKPRTIKHKGKPVRRISKKELVKRFPSLKIQGSSVVGKMKDKGKRFADKGRTQLESTLTRLKGRIAMQSQHTPGPWDLDIITNICVESADLSENGKPGVAEANARLITAAPGLLEAAPDLLSAKDGTNESLRDELRRAVLKAGGKIYSKS
jgi:hypothetical protein